MEQAKKADGIGGWVFWGLFLTALTSLWSSHLTFTAYQRRGMQRTFGPSPPLVPDWAFWTVYALLVLQLAVSVVGVWSVKKSRWWLAVILAVLWLTTLFFAGVKVG